MKDGEKLKNKKIDEVKPEPPEPDATQKTVRYGTIRRMLNTLDRFLTKRFMLVLAFCSAVISMCTIGLVFTNGIVGNASSGNGGRGGNITVNTWLLAIMAVCAFVAVVTAVYAWSRKDKNRA